MTAETRAMLETWPVKKLISIIAGKDMLMAAYREELRKVNQEVARAGVVIGLQDIFLTHKGVEAALLDKVTGNQN